jgi:hypothetical protein
MRTDELVETLSRDPRPRQRLRPATVIALAVLLAAGVEVAVSLLWLGVHDLARADARELLIKLVFAGGVILAALAFVRDLAVPGRRVRLPAAVAVLPFVLMLAFALHEFHNHQPETWPAHAAHSPWLSCLGHICVLALPAFVILALAVRRLAPIHLHHAGFYIGLVAGGFGAMGYALHVREEDFVFSLLAHGCAIALVACAGAWLGSRVLKWS